MIIAILECNHTLELTPEESRKAKVNTLAYCIYCKDLRKIKNKLFPTK